MARPTLMTHRKFARLTRALGSRVIARGVLEIIWDTCYESGDDYLGTAGDIDQIVGWDGDPGKLALALVACGLPEGQGFIEPVNAAQGQEVTFKVHDLWHHAPEYVAGRRMREQERRQGKPCARCATEFFSTDPRAKYCSSACRQGGWRARHTDESVTDSNAAASRSAATTGDFIESSHSSNAALQIGPLRETDRNGRVTDSNGTPALALAPALAPARKSVSSASLLDAEPDSPTVLVFPTIGKGSKTWELKELHVVDWQQAFPGLDILGECRKALAWVKANGLKTSSGMEKFLVNWFNRSVSRGGNYRPQATVSTVRTTPSRSAMPRMQGQS